jgi:carbon-monoxide dehydrogenase large subunit
MHPAGGRSRLGWLTRRLGRPVRWIEDRREQLTAGANCREHHYFVTAHATSEGRILALDVEGTVDSGAYSVYPFTACLEAGQLPSMLPGPYDFRTYRGVSYAVASNKVPITPYRGVARPGACLRPADRRRPPRSRGRS